MCKILLVFNIPPFNEHTINFLLLRDFCEIFSWENMLLPPLLIDFPSHEVNQMPNGKKWTARIKFFMSLSEGRYSKFFYSEFDVHSNERNWRYRKKLFPTKFLLTSAFKLSVVHFVIEGEATEWNDGDHIMMNFPPSRNQNIDVKFYLTGKRNLIVSNFP